MANSPDPMLPHPYMVRRLSKEMRDTFTLDLEPTEGTSAPLCGRPVQHAVRVRRGRGAPFPSVAIRPQRQPLVHTIRAVGAVTRAIAASKRGDCLGVRGPWQRLADGGSGGHDVVLVAGGLGLAPLASGALSSAGAPGAVRAKSCCSMARALLRSCCTGESARTLARPLRSGGAGHRGSRHEAWQGSVGVVTKPSPGALRSVRDRGHALWSGGDDAFHHYGPSSSGCGRRPDLCLHGTQHEVCHRGCAVTVSSAPPLSAKMAQCYPTTESSPGSARGRV